jgi:hypothetical protein
MSLNEQYNVITMSDVKQAVKTSTKIKWQNRSPVAINPDFYISSQTSLTLQAIVFDTNPSAHPLTTSNTVSSLIQLSFGMLYHLILSLLLL